MSGVGKTTVCRELGERGYAAYDIEAVDGLCEMIDPETNEPYEGFDPNDLEHTKRGEWICDKAQLVDRLQDHTESFVFYGGVVSNLDELLVLFDEFVLLVVDPDVLRERLRTRTTNPFGRAPEVQEHVLSWKEAWEDHMRDSGAIEVDANHDLAATVDAVLEAVGISHEP